jgi:hypothetical protein
MRNAVQHIHRPSGSTIIAVTALVFAMGGYAVAVPPDDKKKEEVLLETTSAGPAGNSEGGDRIEFPLTDDSFTQKAGEPVVVIAELDYTGPGAQDPPLDSCQAQVRLQSSALSEERNEVEGLANFNLFPNGLTQTSSVSGVIAPAAADTTHELTAIIQAFCDEVDPPEDFFTVNSLDVTVIRLR